MRAHKMEINSNCVSLRQSIRACRIVSWGQPQNGQEELEVICLKARNQFLGGNHDKQEKMS